MENVGEKIYHLRKEKKVSQEALAEKLSVARQTVSKWERDIAQPTTENIKGLCEFFNVASTYFFGDEKETAAAIDEPTEQISVTEGVKKETKFKTLKTVSIVVGIVLLTLCIIACCVIAYAIIAPSQEGKYVDTVDIVNYEGIIFLVAGIVAAAAFITLTVIFTKKFFKNKKKK